MKEHLSWFSEKVGGGDPFYLKFWVNRTALDLPGEPKKSPYDFC